MVIAVASENGEVFQHFGHTPEFTVYEIEGSVVRGKRVLPTGDSGHGALAGFLRDLCVDLLICGGIGAEAQRALADEGIKLVAGVQGTVDAVVAGYLNGTLKFTTDFPAPTTISMGKAGSMNTAIAAAIADTEGEMSNCSGNCEDAPRRATAWRRRANRC